MTPSARLSAAIELLDSLDAQAGPAEHRIRKYFRTRRYAGSKDRRWVTEFLFLMARRRGEVDWRLEQTGLPQTNRLRATCALIVFQDIKFSDLSDGYFSGPHAAPYLTEDERTGFEKLEGLDFGDMPDHAKGNFPAWLTEELKEQYAEKALPIMQICMERAPLTLRVNSLKTDRDRVLDLLAADEIDANPAQNSPDGIIIAQSVNLNQHAVIEQGLVEIQDEAAQISARLACPAPGMQVVDYCAGAGGKSLAMAAGMENAGQIYAFDVSRDRMKDIASRSRRAGVRNIEAVQLFEDERDDEILGRLAEQADRVFVDAPCSGSGTWRRQPDRKWSFTEERLGDLTALQEGILKKASLLVKPGGWLIYATCSIFRQENERQIEKFLAENTEFSLVPVSDIWASAGLNGKHEGPFLQILPSSGGADGFFTAILCRKSG
ncbi:MAG: RsmB/NOP family class I SAM-dependent RNA methyltransferase [Sneathiella sp.]